MRWAIFIHDPEGDMGYGRVIGGFRSAEAADRKAEQIRKATPSGYELECIVLEQADAGTSARTVARDVIEDTYRGPTC